MGEAYLPRPFSPLFTEFIHDLGLVDIELGSLRSTWNNGREGNASIAKKLDIFLLSQGLLSSFHRYHSWVVSSYVSNHMPIVLQLDSGRERVKYPFKFNPV